MENKQPVPYQHPLLPKSMEDYKRIGKSDYFVRPSVHKAAGLIRDTYKSIGSTIKDVAMKHTPIGVAAAAKGLMKDRAAAKKSAAGLNNVRAMAASKLGQVARQRNAFESGELLTKPLIDRLNEKKDVAPAIKNSIFEKDMRKRQQLGLPR